jgi:hypothetical protein
MHTSKTAEETLEFLWRNYVTLCEQVDLEAMPPDTLDVHIQQNSPVRPFRISAWLARQGYFISAWNLWEYYSRSLCQDLPIKAQKQSDESTVDWVARSLTANSNRFPNAHGSVVQTALGISLLTVVLALMTPDPNVCFSAHAPPFATSKHGKMAILPLNTNTSQNYRSRSKTLSKKQK